MTIEKFDKNKLTESTYITQDEINKGKIKDIENEQLKYKKRVNQLDLDQRFREEELAKRIRKLENEWIEMLNFNIKVKYSLLTASIFIFTIVVYLIINH